MKEEKKVSKMSFSKKGSRFFYASRVRKKDVKVREEEREVFKQKRGRFLRKWMLDI